MSEYESREMAILVTRHLQQFSEVKLEEYIRETYLLDCGDGLNTTIIYAVEVADANFATGDMSSVPMRWWSISRGICSSIPLVDMRPFNTASDFGRLWPHPITSYYANFPHVISREGIGITIGLKSIERQLFYSRVFTVNTDQVPYTVVTQESSWLFAT